MATPIANSGSAMMPAELGRQQQRADHAEVDQQIRLVVQCVGADCDRPGSADHRALEKDERQRRHDRQQHHRDTDRLVADRLALHQPCAGLHQQEHGGAGDEGGLSETGERFRLSVAEAVLPVGRLGGLANGDQVDHRGREIEQRIDQRRQQADRAGRDIGNGLGADQHRRDRDRGDGGELLQAVRAVAADRRLPPFADRYSGVLHG